MLTAITRFAILSLETLGTAAPTGILTIIVALTVQETLNLELRITLDAEETE